MFNIIIYIFTFGLEINNFTLCTRYYISIEKFKEKMGRCGTKGQQFSDYVKKTLNYGKYLPNMIYLMPGQSLRSKSILVQKVKKGEDYI